MVENSNLAELFRKIDVKKSDTIMIHGNLAAIGYKKSIIKKKDINIFFKELINFFKNDGTIIFPTFTYSFIKNKKYNVAKSPSEVGMFSEELRKQKSVTRTKNPIFSIGIFGKNKNLFLKSSISNCFGKDSAFGILKKLNGKIICFGCDFDRITFTHYLEQMKKVDYRFFKTFSGIIISGKNTRTVSTKYYVRKIKKATEIDLSRLKQQAILEKKIKISNFGRFEVSSIKARDFYKIGSLLLNINKSSLIKGY
jgi:aminoglycoside 3-N-acetyltransferase